MGFIIPSPLLPLLVWARACVGFITASLALSSPCFRKTQRVVLWFHSHYPNHMADHKSEGSPPKKEVISQARKGVCGHEFWCHRALKSMWGNLFSYLLSCQVALYLCQHLKPNHELLHLHTMLCVRAKKTLNRVDTGMVSLCFMDAKLSASPLFSKR